LIGIRTAAVLVSAGNAVWLIIAGTFWSSMGGAACSTGGCGNALGVQVLGVILLAVSVVCYLGFGRAFYGSAGLSALAIVVAAVYSATLADAAFGVTAALGVAAVAADIAAAMKKAVVDEQNHPLNLPVFG